MPRPGRGRSLPPVLDDDPRAASSRRASTAVEHGTDGSDDPAEMNPYAGLTEHRRETAIATATATLDEIQRTQGRIRNKDGKLRRGKFIAACLALRYEGFTPKETAETLGCSWQQVTRALSQIRKDADMGLQVERLNQIAVPLAMDNAIRGVMNGDKEYTLRVLDGAGVFRTHKSVTGEIKQTIQSLSVVLTVPAHLNGKEMPMPRAGGVVGAPTLQSGLPAAAVLEGAIVRSEPVAVGTPIVPDVQDTR